MLVFIPAEEFMKKTKIPVRTFYRKKRNLDLITIKLINEYVLVKIEDGKIKPVSPEYIKEFSNLLK